MYKREYKRCAEFEPVQCPPDKNMNAFQPSLVTQFYHEESVSVETGEPILELHDPVYLLFNQERLSKLGSGAVDIWLRQMADSKLNPLAELRKECSDDDLLTMVKSRHLQSPSEILAWSRLMTAKMDEFKSEVAKLVAQKQVSEKPVENVTPNVEPKTE